MPTTLDEQLTKHLTDVHSIEEQALQERRVAERLEARGADPSRTKDLIARVGGIGMLLFAKSQPDTPGKLTAHAYSYEHMEFAAYDLLALVAERGGDAATVALAQSIRSEEGAMA